MSNEVKIIRLSEIQAKEVEWLWHPYIPTGKITMLEGDPGEGKTMLILTLTALLSKGLPLPTEKEKEKEPATVIYQTAEDGLSDTIKPRLEKAGADCERVVVINDNDSPLTFTDERIEQAIIKENAKLMILDPIQAFFGKDSDMHRANEVRPILRQLASVAERTGCAIVIVGHMNKVPGSKGIYRGLGSIDFPAVARSILLVGRSKSDDTVRYMAQLKNNLAPFGKSVSFEITDSLSFIGTSDITAEQILNGGGYGSSYKPTKGECAVEELTKILECGEIPCSEVYAYFEEIGISRRRQSGALQKGSPEGTLWHTTLV